MSVVRSTVVEELREMIGADLPVSDSALLVGAAKLIEGLDEQVGELRAEIARLRADRERAS